MIYTMTQQENKQATRQTMRKYLVFAAMFVVFGICMWWIFAPSAAERQAEQLQAGFNASIPDPEGDGIVGDKKAAYEQEQQRLRQEEKMRTLEEYAFSLDREERIALEPVSENPALSEAPAAVLDYGTADRYGGYGSSRQNSSFDASDAAYRQLSRTLGNFYEEPQEDEEKERLRAEVEALRESLAAQQSQPQSAYDEQVALLEKSYELAAKYMPGQEPKAEPLPTEKNGKALVVPVGIVEHRIVSALQQPQSDSAWLAEWTRPRNREFHTAVGWEHTGTKNTIRACIDCDQTLIDGQGVRLRLMEEMRAGNLILPRNTLIVGTGKIEGERLGIAITSIEYAGTILSVELTVYDSDGQPGIHIPASMEISAVKEVAANLGQNLGTTVSITNQSASDQLLSEVGKGAIQGVSQYISKKIRTVKAHLKEGYRVMLYQNEN